MQLVNLAFRNRLDHAHIEPSAAVASWMSFKGLCDYSSRVVDQGVVLFESLDSLLGINDSTFVDASVHQVSTALIPADIHCLHGIDYFKRHLVLALSKDRRRFLCYQRAYRREKWSLSIFSAYYSDSSLERPYMQYCEQLIANENLRSVW